MTAVRIVDSVKYGAAHLAYLLGLTILGAVLVAIGTGVGSIGLQNPTTNPTLTNPPVAVAGILIALIGLLITAAGYIGAFHKFIADSVATGRAAAAPAAPDSAGAPAAAAEGSQSRDPATGAPTEPVTEPRSEAAASEAGAAAPGEARPARAGATGTQRRAPEGERAGRQPRSAEAAPEAWREVPSGDPTASETLDETDTPIVDGPETAETEPDPATAATEPEPEAADTEPDQAAEEPPSEPPEPSAEEIVFGSGEPPDAADEAAGGSDREAGEATGPPEGESEEGWASTPDDEVASEPDPAAAEESAGGASDEVEEIDVEDLETLTEDEPVESSEGEVDPAGSGSSTDPLGDPTDES